jgi:outer membrane protein OmpA-like peptidoglycan-associated protein
MRFSKLVLPALLVVSAGSVAVVGGCNGEVQLGSTTPTATTSAAAPAPTPTPTPAPTPTSTGPVSVGVHAIPQTGNKIDVSGKIDFNEGQATFKGDGKGGIDPGTLAVLQQVAGVLTQHPEITQVRVDGYTDNIGNAAYNVTLSQQRAQAVVDWLTKQASPAIDPARLVSKGWGAANPIAPNTTPDGQAQNRRTEFRITQMNNQAVPDSN